MKYSKERKRELLAKLSLPSNPVVEVAAEEGQSLWYYLPAK